MQLINGQSQEQLLNDARHFYLVAPVLIPMIEKRRTHALSKLITKYREGSTDFLALVSELATLAGLESEIISKELMYRTMEGRNGNTNS